MAKCKACGSSKFRKEIIQRYADDLMGVAVILVDAVEQEICDVCGTVRGSLIPNLEGLVAAVAVKRATLAHKLNGSELRFMRKALGWKAKELADKLEVAPETVSRWETGPQPMDNQAERYLRLIVGNLLSEKAPRITFDAAAIVNMKIKAICSPRDKAALQFRLIKENSSSGVSENYQPTALAA